MTLNIPPASPVRLQYCLVLCTIATISILIQVSPIVYDAGQYVVIRTAIMVIPLAVAACCMLLYVRYGGSRIFSRSFLMLGIGNLAVFVGEALYYFYLDPTGTLDVWSEVAEALFFASYLFFISHITINVGYFSGRVWPGLLLTTTVSILFAAGFFVWVGADDADLWSLASVVGSVTLGIWAAFAFGVFRQTILSAPWALLTLGILLGSVGDIVYRHSYMLGLYDFESMSTSLWLTSNMVIMYGLYRHCRSI